MNHLLKKVLTCVAAVSTTMLAATAFAHHSTTMFDHATSVTIVGEVREVQWTNPHVAIFIYGVTKEGEPPYPLADGNDKPRQFSTCWRLDSHSR